MRRAVAVGAFDRGREGGWPSRLGVVFSNGMRCYVAGVAQDVLTRTVVMFGTHSIGRMFSNLTGSSCDGSMSGWDMIRRDPGAFLARFGW